MKLTQSQRDAAHAVNRHVLVAAGAGTGKTTTVVARLLYLLGVPVGGRTVPSPLELRRLAAITFTNAAAADLQGKLRTALRDAGRRDAAYEVDTARIGTIHGFCADVLREFALRHARPPAHEVLSEGQSSALTAEAVRDGLLSALEAQSVAGLDQLLAERSVREVEQWVLALLGESDRLRTLSANRQTLGARERALVDLAREVLALVEARLVERGAVDFDRMIVWTRDLLRDDAYTRRTLQRRLHTLVVDEFQDVDPVQKEIAYLLGEPASRRDDTTRLLLVGDPKQSIYRFRRADVTVWAAVERDFGPGGLGQVIPLVENFRSSSEILGFVDATVGTILSQPLDGSRHQPHEVPYQSLIAKQGRGPKGAGVELLLVPSTTEDGRDRPAAELRRLEAQAMARRARELHDTFGVGWGEMAVLLASWGALATYQTALEAVGAPTYAPKASGFWERREVLDVVVALEAIRNPRDDAALFGFLRSPMVGVTDETLLTVARQIAMPYWPRLDSVTVSDGERLARGLELLRRHARLRDRVRTDQLIESLLDESGYVAHLALLGERGTQAIANLRKLVNLARGMRHAGLGELLRTVRETRARGDIEPDARLHVAGDDVLTITSIHQAKGLEWRVVLWCDLIRWMARESGALLLGRDRIALDDPEAEREEDQPESWRQLAETIGREEEAEYRRQWYVAVTRAKERLVVSGLPLGQQVKPKLETPAGWLWRTLPPLMALDGTDVEYAGSDGARHRALVKVVDTARASATGAPTPWPVGDAAALEVPRAPIVVAAGARRHSATELLTFSRCETKHWFRYRLGLREPRVETTSPEFIAAVTRGQIVHDVLERLEEDDQLDVLLEDAIGRWADDAPAPETPPGRRYRKALREEIAAVAVHPDYRAVADRPTARRELAFLHVDGPDAIWAGSVDLAAGDGDGVVLLDVKTSRGSPEDARHRVVHYLPQRDVYVVAAEAIGGLEVRQFAYQFSRAGIQVSERIDAQARARAGTRLAEGLGRMAGDGPRLTDFPAECRFCGYRRVGWCPGVAPEGPSSLDARGAPELG